MGGARGGMGCDELALAEALGWHWHGMAMAWHWHGSSIALVWDWHAIAVAVAWHWYGIGVGIGMSLPCHAEKWDLVEWGVWG